MLQHFTHELVVKCDPRGNMKCDTGVGSELAEVTREVSD